MKMFSGRLLVTAVCGVGLSVLLSGCEFFGPDGRNLSGRWRYEANIEDLCFLEDRTLIIDHSGDTFTGTARGGTFDCPFNGESSGRTLPRGSIRDGRVRNDSVFFQLENVTAEEQSQFIEHSGVLTSSTKMEGQEEDFSWSATKIER